jgi:hypothetical protein
MRPWNYPDPHEILAGVEPAALRPLVSGAARARLLAFASALPFPVHTACYECRLSGEDDRVDLALCILPSAMEWESRGPGLAALRKRYGRSPGWGRALDFLEDWRTGGMPFSDRIPFLWYAFDLPEGTDPLPEPCIGVCADPGFFARRLGLEAESHAAGDLFALTRLCYQRLFGMEPGEEAGKNLAMCLTALPSGGIAKHLSFMLSRNPPTFKLDVALPIQDAGPYLARIGWPDARLPHLDRYMGWNGHVQLNLVLSPALVPPLEVEFLTVPGEAGNSQRRELLECLVASGLCSKAKADVLGRVMREPILRAEPPYLIGSGWYIKIRFRDGEPTEAKAYLGLMPRNILRGSDTARAESVRIPV